MQVTVAMPDDESDQYCIKETEFYFPVGEIHPVDHACYKWNGNSEKWDQDDPEARIIYFIASIWPCRQIWYVGRSLFHLNSFLS